MNTNIGLILLDIDGVITDGTITVDSNGNEQKRINLKDIDALFELHRRGYLLGAITGEDSEIVAYFEKRIPWDYFYRGTKKKLDVIKELEKNTAFSKEEICYVGDGKYDIDALSYARLSICPADAILEAKQAADIVFQNQGGEGCLWELISILEMLTGDLDPEKYFMQRLNAHSLLFKKMASDQRLINQVGEIGDILVKSFANNGAVYLFGNGGSAADAQHIATEFVSRFYRERPGLNAEALTVNTSTLTAVGNDYSFDRVFVRQLEAKSKKGDISIGISTSGTSHNVIEALQYAKEQEIITVLFTSEKVPIEIEKRFDFVLKVPCDETPRIQEAHIFLGHVIAEYAEEKMFGGGQSE